MTIPLTVSELTFERFIEIRAAYDLYKEEPSQERLLQITKYFHDESVPIGELPNEGYMYNIGDEVTHTRTYFHLINLINSYKSDIENVRNGFDFAGEKWVVNAIYNNVVTVSEYIIAMETERRFNEVKDTTGDIDGAFEFNLGLRLFSCLVRKPNEVIPMDKNVRDKWLKERIQIFESIPMDKVLDIKDFFLHMISDFATTTNLSHTSKGSPSTQRNNLKTQHVTRIGQNNTEIQYGSVQGLIQSMRNLLRLDFTKR
jgi:hypothetical protein